MQLSLASISFTIYFVTSNIYFYISYLTSSIDLHLNKIIYAIILFKYKLEGIQFQQYSTRVH